MLDQHRQEPVLDAPATDFVVLHPDGMAFGTRLRGLSLPDALCVYLPDGIGLRGFEHGIVHLWSASDPHDLRLRRNPLADFVIGCLDHHRAGGWYGPVAVTAPADPAGAHPPLSPATLEMITDLWRAALRDGHFGSRSDRRPLRHPQLVAADVTAKRYT